MSMCSRLFLMVFILSLLPGSLIADAADNKMELETSVCGLKEPFLFWLWSSMAGRADASRLKGLQGIEDITLTSRDNRILRGYLLKSRFKQPKGYLLVLQGNAVLADQLIGEFTRYVNHGYDVYIYDYRGYGRSEGKRRLKALVNDAREIVSFLNTKSYPEHLVYAFSFGGIVLLNAYQADLKLDRVVIDSSPSRLSDYGCSEQFDPVIHLPDDSSNFMVISGQNDSVVTPRMTKELLTQAAKRHARIVDDPEYAHPFMDPNLLSHQRRMDSIEQFLLQVENK